MKRFFFLLIISISFYACKPGIPKDIIQPDKMQNVLIDIHLIDGYISTLPGIDTAKKVGSAYYKGVFKKFDIDSALYNSSLNYYYKHPDLMKKMYDSITVKLSVLKEQNSILIDDINKITFKGIFSTDKADTILLDVMLNRKYNIRWLKSNVYFNILNSQNAVNNILPLNKPTPADANQPIAQPETVIQPLQDNPKTQQ